MVNVTRRVSTGLVVVVGVVAAAFAFSALRDTADAGAGGHWPATVTYQLSYLQTEGANALTDATFEWDVESLFNWRQTQTCCDQDIGNWLALEASGEVWSGSSEDEALLVTTLAPDNGLVPIADFGPRYPVTEDDLSALGARLLDDADLEAANSEAGPLTMSSIAEQLSLQTSDLVAYELSTPESDTIRVVYTPLNLLLRLQETSDSSTIIRELVVTDLDFS